MTEAGGLGGNLWDRMPVLRVGLGLCPALAVSTSLERGIGMGASVVFVLAGSSIAAHFLARALPSRVARLCYLAVTGALVTAAGLFWARYAPVLRDGLGIYLPLVAVSCLVLCRLDEEGKGGIGSRLVGALGAGLAFAFAIAAVAAAREIMGAGALWGHPITRTALVPVPGAALAPGAFIVVGLLGGLAGFVRNRKNVRS